MMRKYRSQDASAKIWRNLAVIWCSREPRTRPAATGGPGTGLSTRRKGRHQGYRQHIGVQLLDQLTAAA